MQVNYDMEYSVKALRIFLEIGLEIIIEVMGLRVEYGAQSIALWYSAVAASFPADS